MKNNLFLDMFSIINKTIISTLTYVPKNIIKLISNRYIAGTDDDHALNIIKKINEMDLSATLDILGEHTTDIKAANMIVDNYLNLYKEISNRNLDCNISIKPSHIGTDINERFFLNNLNLIHQESIKRNNFLRIDMENSDLTDITIAVFKKIYPFRILH